MRARDSRLADRLMFVVSVTTNLSQRIAGRLVQLPAPVTFILSQLGPRWPLHFLAFFACFPRQIRVDFSAGSLNQAGIARERHLYYENDAFDGSKPGDFVLSLFDHRAQQFRADRKSTRL